MTLGVILYIIIILYILYIILLYYYIILYYILYYTLLLFSSLPFTILFFLSQSSSSLLSSSISSSFLQSQSFTILFCSYPLQSSSLFFSNLIHSKYTCRYLDPLIYILFLPRIILTPHVLSEWMVEVCRFEYLGILIQE